MPAPVRGLTMNACFCRDDPTTLPALVSEVTDNRWCEAVSTVASSLPAAGEAGDRSFAIVRKVQELSMKTMRALLAQAPDVPGTRTAAGPARWLSAAVARCLLLTWSRVPRRAHVRVHHSHFQPRYDRELREMV